MASGLRMTSNNCLRIPSPSLLTSVLMLMSAGLLLPESQAARILLMPCPHKSTINLFSVMGRTLSDVGHDVHVLILENRRALVDRQGLPVITYPVIDSSGMLQSDAGWTLDGMSDVRKTFQRAGNETSSLCRSIHENRELMAKLERMNFDLLFMDAFDLIRCFYSVAYRLGVPYVSLAIRHDPWSVGIPAMPSVEPMLGLGTFFTSDPSFTLRVETLFKNVFAMVAFGFLGRDDTLVTEFCPDKPRKTYQELYQASEMFMVNLETVCLDTPRVTSPHYVMVAGMGLETARPLDQELEDFLGDSPFIVLTFGSAFSILPDAMIEKLFDGLALVDLKVVMRYSGKFSDRVPANVKAMKWVPQNDLLGHPNVRAFITHGGTNSQMEALHHAVPMITMPLANDQFYNAQRAASKGFAVTVDKDTFTPEDLARAIRQVTTDDSYREKLEQCSDKFTSLPAASDTVIFWVDHILRFGGSHLRPVAADAPVWKLLMLDILAVFVVMLLLGYTALLWCCYAICKRRRAATSRATSVVTTKTDEKKND